MRLSRCCLWQQLLLILLLPALLPAEELMPAVPAISLEFSGYKFGQSPSANMVCSSGYCKSQAPGGDGRVTFPFSTYETPGAVSTLSGLTVVNVRYTFWEERLFRVYFNVDCTPLDTESCIDDITTALDREYGLLPVSATDSTQFALDRRNIYRDFLTDTGALIKVRATRNKEEWFMPSVELLDKQAADRVGSSLNPSFKPKRLPVPDDFGKK